MTDITARTILIDFILMDTDSKITHYFVPKSIDIQTSNKPNHGIQYKYQAECAR